MIFSENIRTSMRASLLSSARIWKRPTSRTRAPRWLGTSANSNWEQLFSSWFDAVDISVIFELEVGISWEKPLISAIWRITAETWKMFSPVTPITSNRRSKIFVCQQKKHGDQSSSEPKLIQSVFFQTMKDTLTFEQSSTMNLRPDVIRQYLFTCLIDPAFFSLVHWNEEMLKKLLTWNCFVDFYYVQ